MSVPAASGELLADRAYAELRDRIVTLAIPPGAPINEDALGRDLEMGRTPVREAIKRLALERLVTVFPRRGTFGPGGRVSLTAGDTAGLLVSDGEAVHWRPIAGRPEERNGYDGPN